MSQPIPKSHSVYPLYAHLENLKTIVDEQITSVAFLSDKQVEQEAVTCLREIKQIIENLVSTIISQNDSPGVAQVSKEAFIRDSKTILQKIHLLANNDRGSKNGDLAKIEKVFKEKIKLPPREMATWQELRLRNEQKLIKASQEFAAFMGNLKTTFSSERTPIIFISYARPLSERPYEVWIEKFLLHFQEHLQAAGIKAELDRTHSPIGGNAYAFMQSIDLVDFVILIGTESLKDKHYSEETRFVQTELNLARAQKGKVLPMLLSGDLTCSFPEAFLGYTVIGDFLDPNSETQTSYLTALKCLLEIIFKIPVLGDTKKHWDQLWKQFENTHPILAKGLKKTEVEERQKIRKEKQEKKEQQRQADELKSREAASVTRQLTPSISSVSFELSQATPSSSHVALTASRENLYSGPPTLLFHLSEPYEHFIKREIYSQVEEALLPKVNFRDARQLLAIYGLGGIGKSELGRDFANRYKERFSLVYWIDAETLTGLNAAYAELAWELAKGLPDAFTQELKSLIKKEDHEGVRNALFRELENPGRIKHLAGTKPWLLIYDNVEQELALPNRGGCILGTSQDAKVWPDYKQHTIELREFSDEEALIFIKRATEQSDELSMKELIRELGAFPLALGQAVADIVDSKIAIAEYLKEIQEDRNYKLWESDREGTQGHKQSLVKTWKRTLERLKSTSFILEWLNLCAWLNPVAISDQWLEAWLSSQKKLTRARLTDTKRNIVNILRNLGIARFDSTNKSFSLHRLIQDLLQNQQSEKVKEEHFSLAITLLQEQFKPFIDPDVLPSKEEIKIWLAQASWLYNNSLVKPLARQADWLQSAIILAAKLRRDRPSKESSLLKNPNNRTDIAVIKAMQKDPLALRFASNHLKKNKEILLWVIEDDPHAFYFVSDELKNDRSFALALAKSIGQSISDFRRNSPFNWWVNQLICPPLSYISLELKSSKEFILSALEYCEDIIEYAAPELKGDPEIILAAVEKNGELLRFASAELRDDTQIVYSAIESSTYALRYASKRFWNDTQLVQRAVNDRQVVLRAVERTGTALKYASIELRNDRDIVLSAAQKDGTALEYASEELRNDRDIVLAAVQKKGEALKYASAELRNDRDVVLAAVHEEGKALKYASTDLRNDPNIVLSAKTFKFASLELLNDRQFMLAAVQKKGEALKYASAELRKDREIVLAAVQKEGNALKYASPELQNDRGIVLAAVHKNEGALRYASDELRNDREVGLASVHAYGYALDYLSPELRNDRYFMLAAVQKEGNALEYASPELRNDKEFILAAVQSNVKDISIFYEDSCLKYASKALQNDKEFVLKLVQIDWRVFQHVSAELRDDPQMVLAATKKCSFNFRWASNRLLNNKEFVLSGVNIYWGVLKYATRKIQSNIEVVATALGKSLKAFEYVNIPKSDRDYMLALIKMQALGLKFAAEELRKDKEIVLTAVTQNGKALKFASAELQKDKEVVLAAVNQNGKALKFVSAELRKDQEVVLAAVTQNWKAVMFAKDLMSDIFKGEVSKEFTRKIIFILVQNWGSIINYVPELQSDREIVYMAVNQNGWALSYASRKLRNDPEIVLAAVRRHGLALMFASEALRKDKQIVLAAIKQDPRASKYASFESQI